MTMKVIKLFILSAVVCCFIQACNNNMDTKTESKLTADMYSCPVIYKGDSINKTYNGIKQGHFVLFDTDVERNTAFMKSPPDNPENEKQKSTTSPGIPIEEGDYKDNKKQGVWIYYNTDGSVKKQIEYKDDVPVK